VGPGDMGGVEDALTLLPDDLHQAEVNVGGSVQSDARVAVLGVVVLEEPFAERPGNGEVGEALGEGRGVLERLELGFGVRDW
jgi:hypothetical protein